MNEKKVSYLNIFSEGVDEKILKLGLWRLDKLSLNKLAGYITTYSKSVNITS